MSILQRKIPYDPLADVALPGVSPLDPAQWLIVDEAYAGQVTEKARVISMHGRKVVNADAQSDAAAKELLAEVLRHLVTDHNGFSKAGDSVTTPDGRHVDCRGDPLLVLSQLVQEDFAIMQRPEGSDEHILTAALLAFPASWRLEEKFMRPLTDIHVPVKSYDANMAKRVQRLFDGVRVGQPLWRYNALWYQDPELYQPRSQDERRPMSGKTAPFMRTERQTLFRLPLSQAVVFGIHTYVVRAEDLELANQ